MKYGRFGTFVAIVLVICGCAQAPSSGSQCHWSRIYPFRDSDVSIALPRSYGPMPIDGIDSQIAKYESRDSGVVIYVEIGMSNLDLTGRAQYQTTPIVIQGKKSHIITYLREDNGLVSDGRDNAAHLHFVDDALRTRVWAFYEDSYHDEVIAILKSFRFGCHSQDVTRVPVEAEPSGWQRVRPIEGVSRSIAIPRHFSRGEIPNVYPSRARFVSSDGDVEVFMEYGGDSVDLRGERDYSARPVQFEGIDANIVTFRRDTKDKRNHAMYLIFDDPAVATLLWVHYDRSAEEQARAIIASFRF